MSSAIAISATTQFENKSAKVVGKIKKAKYENLLHAARSMRKDAIASIKKRKDRDAASPAGTPVFTHTGLARISLRYDVDKSRDEAVMGFLHSKLGTIGETHEKGLVEDGRDYPERPTIGPTLERNVDRFAADWRASIG